MVRHKKQIRKHEDRTLYCRDIMNEPRCGSQTVICQPDDRIYTFVSNMVSYLKTDPTIGVKQLVTVGTEGFFSTGEFAGIYKGPSQSGVNPYYEEGASLADFGTLCALVDFCEFNIYPDLYHQENPGWVEAWVEAHSVVAVKLQKPVIVKEQGMQPTSKRKEFFKIMYETELGQILNDRDLDGGLKGVAYWEAFARGTEAVFWTKSDGGRWGIYPFDPEIKSIKALSKELRQLNGIKFPCPSVNMEPALTQPVKVPPPPQCPQGYHGIGCEDIDECVLGLHDCSINAACINNPGSYKCECYKGWHGNGRICVSMPISQFHILTAFYTNDSLSCISTSEDVEYPVTAPGYVEDPTGYFPPHSATSRIPTSLTECKVACLMAGECTSFYFDPIQGQCILKKNECPYTQATIPGCDPSTCGRTPHCYSPNETSCTMVVYHDGSSAPNPAVATYPCTRGITYFLKEANFINDKCVPPTH